ncbi:MAG TPA: hypothetical protein PKN75_05880 [Bacteroidia bacterium]|nr:hypothetical protein [Bacteroidia bacterium]HNU33104.1 hypothetical protein [Bacteroidia bacterium]
MDHNNHSHDSKGQTFFFKGGTGAFTVIWMLIVLSFLFSIIRWG